MKMSPKKVEEVLAKKFISSEHCREKKDDGFGTYHIYKMYVTNDNSIEWFDIRFKSVLNNYDIPIEMVNICPRILTDETGIQPAILVTVKETETRPWMDDDQSSVMDFD